MFPILFCQVLLSWSLLTPEQAAPVIGPASKQYTFAVATISNYRKPINGQTPASVTIRVSKARVMENLADQGIPAIDDVYASQAIFQMAKFGKAVRFSRIMKDWVQPFGTAGIAWLAGSVPALGFLGGTEFAERSADNIAKLAPDVVHNMMDIAAKKEVTLMQGQSDTLVVITSSDVVRSRYAHGAPVTYLVDLDVEGESFQPELKMEPLE